MILITKSLLILQFVILFIIIINTTEGYAETKQHTRSNNNDNQNIKDDNHNSEGKDRKREYNSYQQYQYAAATPAAAAAQQQVGPAPGLYYTTITSNKPYLPDRLLADVDYFDNLSVESHLNSKQFVETQIRCLIYDGTCDFFGRKAKELLPSIILDNCRLCTEEQKDKLYKVIVHLQQHYPGPWNDALIKYGGSPKFITAGQVVPGATFFGSHKRPSAAQNNNDEPVQYSGVVHYRSTLPPRKVDELNHVIPTPQAVTISHETAAFTEDQPATTQNTDEAVGTATFSPEFNPNSNSNNNNDYYNHHPMTMTSTTFVAPIPVLASISATSTSPMPDQLNGVVESPPVFPTSAMKIINNKSQNNNNNEDSIIIDPTTMLPSSIDLNSPSSSSSLSSIIQLPSTVESTIHIKPTTIEPFLQYQN